MPADELAARGLRAPSGSAPHGHHLRPIRAPTSRSTTRGDGFARAAVGEVRAGVGWPPDDDLRARPRGRRRHEAETAAHATFAYAVLDEGETALPLVYIDPPDPASPPGTDAVALWWVVDDAAGGGSSGRSTTSCRAGWRKPGASGPSTTCPEAASVVPGPTLASDWALNLEPPGDEATAMQSVPTLYGRKSAGLWGTGRVFEPRMCETGSRRDRTSDLPRADPGDLAGRRSGGHEAVDAWWGVSWRWRVGPMALSPGVAQGSADGRVFVSSEQRRSDRGRRGAGRTRRRSPRAWR